jgi:hypothetical protein
LGIASKEPINILLEAEQKARRKYEEDVSKTRMALGW